MTIDSFIKTMIENRWNNFENKVGTNYWDKTIVQLSDHEKHQLISVCLDAIGIRLRKEKIPDVLKAINSDEDFLISSDLIDIEQHFNRKILYNILDCIVISEFHLNSLLILPQEMRAKRLENLSKSMNIDISLIVQVDQMWQSMNNC